MRIDKRHLAEAEAHVQAWQQQQADAAGVSARRQAARRRAAYERAERLRRAVDAVHTAQQQRADSHHKDPKPEEARANETDPDARRMKLPHGGYAMAYNVQTVLDLQHEFVVTTTVGNQPSDNGLLQPMLAQVQQEQGSRPKEVLVDSGFVDAVDIDAREGAEVTIYMPPRNEKKDQREGRDPYAAKRRDTPLVAQWRARMGTAAAQQVYHGRCGPAERVHAWMVQRDWRRFRLRGLAKAKVEALWQALTHNLKRLLALQASGRALPVRAAVG
jgi:hypothetical protein